MLARARMGLLRSVIALAVLAGLLACDASGITWLPPDDGGLLAPQQAIALAGADLTVLEGTRVQLDGHASRALGPHPLSLTWSQVSGPPVLLANPTSPAPTFVAPLAPAELRFRLRAESGGEVDSDEVVVRVGEAPGAGPVFLEVPGDIVGIPGEQVSFEVGVVGADPGAVRHLSAEPRCADDPLVELEGRTVSLALPDALPCVLLLDAILEDGRAPSRVALVFWPAGTPVIAETRAQAPVLVEPGTEALLRFETATSEMRVRAWPAGGAPEGLEGLTSEPLVTLTAPPRRTRLFLGAEQRLGPISGGVRYLLVDVSAGAGNRAPVASGGADRVVRPGASFSLNMTGSADLDGDPLTLEATQVLGPEASPDAVRPGLFVAPPQPGTLLFHVTAFDGRVVSEPDSVRVVVDAEAESRPPQLILPPVRYVTPGESFVLDASSASDPDSGFIERWSISQSAEDPVMLLPTPSSEPVVELVAGEDGERYHFHLAAFDEDGLAALADVEVIVETAGPYIDLTRGDEETGNGTAERPFRSVEQALPVAVRHAFEELRLGSGAQAPFEGELPAGLSLQGGFVWHDVARAWTDGGPPSQLPVSSGGVSLRDGALSQLELTLEGPGASVRIDGRSVLSHVFVREGPMHEGPLLEVQPAATASFERVTLEGGTLEAPGEGDVPSPLLDVGVGASLRLSDSSLRGGSGGRRSALRCEGATIDVNRSTLQGAAGGTHAVGIEALDCDIQLLASTVAGGAADQEAVGLRAIDTLLFIAPDTTVVGASGDATSGAANGATSRAVALEVTGEDEFVVVAGALDAAAEPALAVEALGLFAGSPRVELTAASVRAVGRDAATGIHGARERLQSTGSSLVVTSEGDTTGVLVDGPAELVLQGGSFDIVGRVAYGVRTSLPAGLEAPRVSDLVIAVTGTEGAAGLALGASREVTLERVDVTVVAGAATGIARALGVASGTVRESTFTIAGDGAVVGLSVASQPGPLVVDRVVVEAMSHADTATALLTTAPVELSSTFLSASGGEATALEARAPASLRHVTLRSDGVAVRAAASGAPLSLANSALFAEIGIERTGSAPPLDLAARLAFSAMKLYADGELTLTSVAELASSGICDDCLAVEPGVVDETGHLTPGDNPLVDNADASYPVELDVDGETRPQGLGPDIGCDERPAAGG